MFVCTFSIQLSHPRSSYLFLVHSLNTSCKKIDLSKADNFLNFLVYVIMPGSKELKLYKVRASNINSAVFTIILCYFLQLFRNYSKILNSIRLTNRELWGGKDKRRMCVSYSAWNVAIYRFDILSPHQKHTFWVFTQT